MRMNMNMARWICYAVGYVFIASGVMKLLVNDFRATFYSLGLPFPETTLYLVALIEIACGGLIIGRMYVRQAVAPLIFIMLGALYFAKIPVLMNEGFVPFAFEARLDIVMIILLLLLWQQVRGKVVHE